MTKQFEFFTKDLASIFFDQFYLLNLETHICTEYNINSGDTSTTFSYDEHIVALARNMRKTDCRRFLNETELPHVQVVLNETNVSSEGKWTQRVHYIGMRYFSICISQ